MMQVNGGTIQEAGMTMTTTVASYTGDTLTGGTYYNFGVCQPYTWYQSYPVYICTDKTKKAIDVLKALQAEKLLKCDSVPRFIELVDKIANLL